MNIVVHHFEFQIIYTCIVLIICILLPIRRFLLTIICNWPCKSLHHPLHAGTNLAAPRDHQGAEGIKMTALDGGNRTSDVSCIGGAVHDAMPCLN